MAVTSDRGARMHDGGDGHGGYVGDLGPTMGAEK